MSTMSDFYAKVMADEAVKKQITDILGDAQIENADDEQLKMIGEVAKGMGFSISVEDAKAYFGANEEELSDESLEAVAGGVDGTNKPGVPTDDRRYNCDGYNGSGINPLYKTGGKQ